VSGRSKTLLPAIFKWQGLVILFILGYIYTLWLYLEALVCTLCVINDFQIGFSFFLPRACLEDPIIVRAVKLSILIDFCDLKHRFSTQVASRILHWALSACVFMSLAL
jgi:hypothetical protein